MPGVFLEVERKQMAQDFFMCRGQRLFFRTNIVIVNASGTKNTFPFRQAMWLAPSGATRST